MDRQTILLVEDSPGIREAVASLLELEGYRVETAADGQEALAKLESMPKPCLILLDLMMPTMDGWSFSAVREKDVRLAPIPLVLVSGAPNQEAPPEPGTVLKKPIDFKLLKEIVKNYCECS